MHTLTKYRVVFLVLVLCALTACKDWEDHNATNSDLKITVYGQIANTPSLSRFNELLVETGLDVLLKSPNMFTVWAPSNTALENVEESILTDPEKLKNFVSNHITYNAYYTYSAKPTIRIKMLTGKYYSWYTDNLDGVTLQAADQYTNNGVLHIINTALKPVPNSWEYINSITSKHTTFIKSLNYNLFVDSLATKTGVDANGNPIYKPGTGLIAKNRYLDLFPFLADETSSTTTILLTDQGFDAEVNKFKGYFATPSVDTTTLLTSEFIVKELFLNKLYTLNLLPDTLISLWNSKVPIDKSAIVETIKTSNGIVYKMGKVDFKVEDLVKTIVIEGEDFLTISNLDKFFYVLVRNRDAASGGKDLRVTVEHKITGFYVQYSTMLYSVAKYKVFWVANNDFNYVRTTPTPANGLKVYTDVLTSFNQRLAMGSPTNATFINMAVGLNSNARVYLGEYTVPGLIYFKRLNLYLTAASSTTPLVLDKIELEPVY